MYDGEYDDGIFIIAIMILMIILKVIYDEDLGLNVWGWGLALVIVILIEENHWRSSLEYIWKMENHTRILHGENNHNGKLINYPIMWRVNHLPNNN